MISSSATNLRQSLLCVAIWLLCAGVMHADGGRVLAEKHAGVYRVLLFGNPSPLRAGLVDLSLFLEQAEKSGYLIKRRAP